jgi:hypothetical protein
VLAQRVEGADAPALTQQVKHLLTAASGNAPPNPFAAARAARHKA